MSAADSHDAQAITHSLQCSIPSLRQDARRHVARALRQEGSTRRAAVALGVARSTLMLWLSGDPTLWSSVKTARSEKSTGGSKKSSPPT